MYYWLFLFASIITYQLCDMMFFINSIEYVLIMCCLFRQNIHMRYLSCAYSTSIVFSLNDFWWFFILMKLTDSLCTVLTVVEQKDYHFLAVATVSDLQNSHWNQWPHSYEPQICNRFVISAVCLHFAAILTKFAEKTSAKKTMCLWMKSPC